MELEDIEFKAELTALDYINSRPEKEKERMIEEIRLIAVSIIKPKLTYEEILSIKLSDFNKILQKYMSKLGKKLHEDIAQKTQKPPGAMTKGFNFLGVGVKKPLIPLSRMDDKEIE